MKKCLGSEELFSVKQRRLGNNLNIVQRYEEKLFISFLLRVNSRKWAFTAIWGIHVIIENSFLRQKFLGFFLGPHYWKKFVDLFFWRPLNTKCFLISFVLLRYNSMKDVAMKMIAFPEFFKPKKMESRSFFSCEIIVIKMWKNIVKYIISLMRHLLMQCICMGLCVRKFTS